MKVAVKSSAMPTSPTASQQFTDAVFSSDVKLFMPFMTRATATDTITADYAITIGATDGTNQFSTGFHAPDNVTAAVVRSRPTSANILTLPDQPSTSTLADATGDTIATGGELTWTDWNANELVAALLLGGSDVTSNVQMVTLNGTTDVAVTHGLGATPDIIICVTGNTAEVAATGQWSEVVGFYDHATTGYATVVSRFSTGTTTNMVQAIYTDCIGAEVSGSALVHKITVNTVGSTTFNIVADAATTDVVFLISLKVTGGAFKVGTFLTKTSAGTQADITGMAQKPKLVFYLPTFITSANGLETVHSTTGTSESAGLGIAVDNEGTTEQACIASWGDDGVTTQLGKCVTSNTKAGYIFDGSGAKAVDWSISSWDGGGITNNYSTADATGRYVAYLAIAPASASTNKGRLLMLGVG